MTFFRGRPLVLAAMGPPLGRRNVLALVFLETAPLGRPGGFRAFLVGLGFSRFESGVGSGSILLSWPSCSMSESMRFESDAAAFDFEGLFESKAPDFGFGIAQ